MRYAAEQKLEIIRLVENSHLGVKCTLDKLGVARPTFYRWHFNTSLLSPLKKSNQSPFRMAGLWRNRLTF